MMDSAFFAQEPDGSSFVECMQDAHSSFDQTSLFNGHESAYMSCLDSGSSASGLPFQHDPGPRIGSVLTDDGTDPPGSIRRY